MGQPGDDVGAGEVVGLGPQHQVAGAQAQAAVVDQQVTHLHLLADPRVMHAEPGQVPLHRIIPAQLALLHQSRQQRGGHRLAVGGDLEQRVLVDAAAITARTFGALVDHPPLFDHGHGQPGQVLVLDHGRNIGIDRGGRSRLRRRNREHHQRRHAEAASSVLGWLQ